MSHPVSQIQRIRSAPQAVVGNKRPWREALAGLEGAYSISTIRGYEADFAAFETWCKSVALKSLPARPSTVAWFIEVDAHRSAASTLNRRLSAIRKVHRLFRLQNPGADEEVLIAMRRALRSKLQRPNQAQGLTRDLRDQLIQACPATLTGKRNRAMIALGYDTLCRRSELVGLRAEDLSENCQAGATILIRRAKNDPFGSGRLGYVSDDTCELVRDWLKAGGIAEGWIFRSVRIERIGDRPLHPYSVNRILKEAAEKADLPASLVRKISGHSMRVGAAQDLIASGLDILPLMQAGGWKTMDVVGRYVEKANLAPLLLRARQGVRTPASPPSPEHV